MSVVTSTIIWYRSLTRSPYVYDSVHWPAYTPLINLTVVNPETMRLEEFASICSIMGIASIAAVSTPPAAPTATTVFVKEDDVGMNRAFMEVCVAKSNK